jgi:hypothetical protein
VLLEWEVWKLYIFLVALGFRLRRSLSLGLHYWCFTGRLFWWVLLWSWRNGGWGISNFSPFINSFLAKIEYSIQTREVKWRRETKGKISSKRSKLTILSQPWEQKWRHGRCPRSCLIIGYIFGFQCTWRNQVLLAFSFSSSDFASELVGEASDSNQSPMRNFWLHPRSAFQRSRGL